jgi:DNA repair exonuclease SbcCD nuclease subunit
MIVFSGDWHLHPWKRFSTINKEGYNTRLWEQIEALTGIINWANDHGAEYFVIPGDLFHAQGEYLNKDVIRAAYVLLDRINAEVILLPGNHDIYRNKTVFRHFKEIAHVLVEPTVMPIAGEDWGFLPFCRKQEDFIASLEKVDGADHLVCHQMFEGTRIGPEPYDFKLKETFPTTSVASFKSVVSGHCHKHQFLKPNIWFVGSPYQMEFGDEGDDRGFIFYQEGSYNFAPVAGPRFETVELKTQEAADHFMSKRVGGLYFRVHLSARVDLPLVGNHQVEIFKQRKKVTEERVQTKNKSHEEIIASVAQLMFPNTDMDKAALRFWNELDTSRM